VPLAGISVLDDEHYLLSYTKGASGATQHIDLRPLAAVFAGVMRLGVPHGQSAMAATT
jgi:hypothetical protein